MEGCAFVENTRKPYLAVVLFDDTLCRIESEA